MSILTTKLLALFVSIMPNPTVMLDRVIHTAFAACETFQILQSHNSVYSNYVTAFDQMISTARYCHFTGQS